MNFLYGAYFNGNINDDRLKFLKDMGYKVGNLYPTQSEDTGVATSSNTKNIHFIPKKLFFDINPHRSWNINGRINCWMNWNMFTKVISLSDSINQYSPVILGNIEPNINENDFPYKKGDIIHLNEIPPHIFVDYKYATLSDILNYFGDMGNND